MVRCFISIDVEDRELLDRIMEISSQLLATGALIKPVERENIHLTLKFLGEISPALIDKVYDVMRAIEFKPFIIKLETLGAFPSVSNPRVIWIGVSEGANAVVSIYEQLERGLEKLGFKREREKFIPHITLARVKGPRNKGLLVKKIMELSTVSIGEMNVNRIRLKQSILTPKGPIYKTLREVER